MECEEKDMIAKENTFKDQISQLSKDKQRLDELMTIKDQEISALKDNIRDFKK